ncbi:hypothetical protein QYM36_003025 [Artemia franciscana]|uniref:Uncharacterized protein n=1 Tax=Artemia franciscana TaxID=6661 RepID=A0AA88I7F5_ARTSF|nr:hypothetical protein QYM36_003025 [Artemia franciscana]
MARSLLDGVTDRLGSFLTGVSALPFLDESNQRGQIRTSYPHQEERVDTFSPSRNYIGNILRRKLKGVFKMLKQLPRLGWV